MQNNTAINAVDRGAEPAILLPPVTQGLNDDLLVEAKDATELEHRMTLRQALRLYPKAVGWSMLLSLALVMEGYDTLLLGSFYAFPTFVKKFGELQANGSYEVSAAWQAGLSNGAQVGEFFGLFIAGYASDKFGYRKTMIAALITITAFIFIQFFAPNIQTLQAGYILCGLPCGGVFQTITQAYAAEVCPIALRAYLTTYVNLCWLIGQFLASGILRGTLSVDNEWGYRICYAIQWFWPVPIITGVFFAPESPWWLVRHDRIEDASKAIDRLTTKADLDFNTEQNIAMIVHTNDMEKKVSEGTSYVDCFKGSDWRRTQIASTVYLMQAFCGSALFSYSTYFYEQAGLPTTQSFNFTLIQYGLGAFGTMCSWAAMTYIGRRTLISFILLLSIGCISVTASASKGGSWAIGSILLAFILVYNCTLGPVCYALVAEIPSTRLRSKTIVIARNVQNVGLIVNNIVTPYMLNPTAWNWKGKTGFFWAGINAVLFVWAYFKLPEPKGLAYSELDVLFERKISARKFGTTAVDPFKATSTELDGPKSAVAMVENVKEYLT
ncbi:general substrate transporter [Lipomyces doorenjongii]